MQLFQELGSQLERSWKDRNYDDEVFPALAMKALKEAHLVDRVDPWEVVRWVHSTTELPRQYDIEASFGNPPITLYSGPRFYIDIYFWTDGTTSIHQHAFCGAYQVLLGGSIHSKYRFDLTREINPQFLVGRTELESVELLQQGDLRPIMYGDRYIHSLFHLERPSATIVARTAQSPGGAPQYSYKKPSFAFHPFHIEALEMRRRQTTALLLSIQHPRADELIGELISASDFQTAFFVLQSVFHTITNDALERVFGLQTGAERFDALLSIARRRHGELADLIPAVLAEEQRQYNITKRRSQITGSEHRFFLALLLNVPDRVRVLELIAGRFPDADPVETVLRWVEELARTRSLGSAESNVLGIREFDEDYELVLHGLLEGLSCEEIKSRFAEECPDEVSSEMTNKLEALYESIRREMLFKAIF